ncbi:hypothetical protein CLU79DRAFT_758619 [Phycomyces nitens]|nr:hypothetical protein CLU79DRAFT_758619 [Phycomyces nitens]
MKLTLIVFAALATLAAADSSSVASAPSSAAVNGSSVVSHPTSANPQVNPMNGATATASIYVVGSDKNKDSGAGKLSASIAAGLLIPAISYALL